MVPENPWRVLVLASESIIWAGTRGGNGGPAGLPAEVIGQVLVEQTFAPSWWCWKAAMHAQLLAQEDWRLRYTEEADHGFMEPEQTQYCFVDILPLLAEQTKKMLYVDDTHWFSADLQAV